MKLIFLLFTLFLTISVKCASIDEEGLYEKEKHLIKTLLEFASSNNVKSASRLLHKDFYIENNGIEHLESLNTSVKRLSDLRDVIDWKSAVVKSPVEIEYKLDIGEKWYTRKVIFQIDGAVVRSLKLFRGAKERNDELRSL